MAWFSFFCRRKYTNFDGIPYLCIFTNTTSYMKKIIIIDGGPRATFNTASMLQKFAEGASSVSNEIEVKTIRLYALDYKGCMSCMACKIKGKASNVCKFKDALTPVLEEIAQADGLVLGSPNYFGEITGQMRAFLERLAFPWLSYNDYSITAPKRMPVVETVCQQHLPSEKLRQFRVGRILGGSQTQVSRGALGRRPAKGL